MTRINEKHESFQLQRTPLLSFCNWYSNCTGSLHLQLVYLETLLNVYTKRSYKKNDIKNATRKLVDILYDVSETYWA